MKNKGAGGLVGLMSGDALRPSILGRVAPLDRGTSRER
jgi:hypothetical protein